MPKQPFKALLLQQLRRDVAMLTGIFTVLLIWLALIGELRWTQSFWISLFLIAMAIIYTISRAARISATRNVSQTISLSEVERTRRRAQQQVLDGFSQPALILTHDRIEYSNKAAMKLFNLPRPKGLSSASLRHPALLNTIAKALASRQAMVCEFNPAYRTDEPWLAELVVLDTTEVPARLLISLFDQKSVRLASSARSDFLANASHELRTPLTSISGFIETMKGPARHDLKAWPRFIDIIDQQVSHMRALVKDLLSLSRIELAEHMAPTTQIDLTAYTLEAIKSLIPQAKARQVRLKPPDQTSPLIIRADPDEVKQVIVNLLGNALKYSPEGSVIKIELGQATSASEAEAACSRRKTGAGRHTIIRHEKMAGPAAWLRIKDKGPGIEEDILPRLGERFFRADASRGGPIEGTGLGLAIVKHIMAHHKGGIAVETRPGSGTAFSVWFPCAKQKL